jgi:hypothetical protein
MKVELKRNTMAQQANSGKKSPQQKEEKNGGKRSGTITPDTRQTDKTGPSGLHNITAEPGTTE